MHHIAQPYSPPPPPPADTEYSVMAKEEHMGESFGAVKQVSFSQARIAEAVRDYQNCCARTVQLYDVPSTAAVHVLCSCIRAYCGCFARIVQLCFVYRLLSIHVLNSFFPFYCTVAVY
jgi:hypothetical protein